MTTPNGFQIPGGGSYGFGLARSSFNGRPIIWHNDQIGGFTAETAVFLDTGFSVVVLTNDQDADPDALVLKDHECGVQFLAALRELLILNIRA
jgi:hypothetical protein